MTARRGSAVAAGAASEAVLKAPSRWGVPVRELVERKELLGFLVWRDIKIRYRQTAIGVAWVLLQPLLAMAVFTLIFGRLGQLSPDSGPYFLFVYAGLAPWLYFSAVLAQSSNSLVDNERLVTKIYFPRLYVPLAPVLGGLLDLVVSSSLLLVLALLFAESDLGWAVLTLPLWALLAASFVAAMGAALAATNVHFRDVRYALPFLVQLMLFLSPVAYSSSVVPDGWRLLYALNPLSTAIDGYRWAVLGADLQPGPVAVSVVTAVVAVIAAGLVFHASERSFADVL